MSDFATRSFWLGHKAYEPGPRLDGSTKADVVIVGGGFTGLWTAIQLRDADPSIDVVVLEREVVGYGASGRNGGFAMTMITRNIAELARKVGDEPARRQHLAMVDSLREMLRFAEDEGIEADITKPGMLTVSTVPEQDARVRRDVEAAERIGLTDFHYLEGTQARELLKSERIRCGHWEDDGLLVDPAALVRGLKRSALRRGVRVFELTPVESIDAVSGTQVEVRTSSGIVAADKGLIATNAYAHSMPELRRNIFTIYSYITLTEPLSEEQWQRVGWGKRMGVEDKRIMLHFHRPTADGRILWGGRDAPFVAGGPDGTKYDRDPHIFDRLEESFRWTFPQLDDVKIEHAWGGPVCGTLHCIAILGPFRHERLYQGLGYAGHGVGPAHLAGKILRDMLLGRKSELTELPMATKKPFRLPPGPLRSWALSAGQNALLRADDQVSRPGLFTKLALRYLQ